MKFGKKKEERTKPWYKWFAWYPVCLPDGRYAWLQFVERKITGRWLINFWNYSSEYRLLENQQ